MSSYPQNYEQLVDTLLVREKKGRQVNRGQMREVVSRLCDLLAEGNHRQRHTLLSALQTIGLKRLREQPKD